MPSDAIRREGTGDKLNAFARLWKLDGDYIRCRCCNRPQQVSYMLWDFPHADGCKNKAAAERNPWLTLNGLITARVPYAYPAPEGETANAQ